MTNPFSQEIIDSKSGKAFVPGMVAGGYAFMIIGIFPVASLTLGGIIEGIIIFLLGCFIVFTTAGIELDITNKKVNDYWKYFNIVKSKSWKNIQGYPYIAVLKLNKTYGLFSKSNRSVEISEMKYEVYLLDKSQHERLQISSFSTAEDAKAFAKSIADKLKIEYTTYHPETSARRKR
jgi:hypothetical protein